MQNRAKRGTGGRQADPTALDEVRTLLADAPRARELLIEHLHRLQDRYGGLRNAHLMALAQELGLAPVEVFEVAGFYHHFDLLGDGTEPAALTVRVCDSLSCSLSGSGQLAQKLEARFGERVRVERVPCVGRCAGAPVTVVGANPLERATVESVAAAVEAGATRCPLPTPVDYRSYRAQGGYGHLRALQRDASPDAVEGLIATLERADLRGLGGAGFPAGRKWRAVCSFSGPRLMAVNIDEGEPGTFKDRHYLEREPHRLLEGMLIAARAVEAQAVYVYLRDEYAGCREMLAAELEVLTADPPCPIPPIHLRRGAGAYVCGEESAMLESIEGRRGLPRGRPPYVAQRGLFGRPTLVHNLETLYWIPEILERGADRFLAGGRNGRRGLRTFSVSGRVTDPGVYRAPAGIGARELIDEYCGGMQEGHRFKAYLPGGASGGILPAELGHLPLDFDTLAEQGCFLGSAALIVLSDRDSVRGAALNALRFFARESCGQCTPCRAGTTRAVELLQQPGCERSLLEDLCEVMAEASICGLGQAAANPLRCLLRHFPQELE
jgi:NADH:ubiquinone oxidoreductase subunit F (NADH-binding)/NADH:ubiquinone oxidoreductase subunit E